MARWWETGSAHAEAAATPRVIHAAATIIPTQSLERSPRTGQAWQERAWKLWRLIGELHYPTSYMAEQAARCGWNVNVNGKDLTPEESAAAIDAVTVGLGPREAARLLALNLEVAGEVLYGRRDDAWEVIAAGTINRVTDTKDLPDPLIRVWMSDPTAPNDADSPVRAVLDVAEEIRVMGALSRSQTRNRLKQSGIFLVPTEGQFDDDETFATDLEKSMTTPIADEYSASAVVPLVVHFPAEYIPAWRHVVLESPYDDKLQDRIDNAIRRLALGLNMPPQVLLGAEDSNHWSAYFAQEDTYRAHVEPLATLVAWVFAQAIEAALADGSVIVVTPDPSELLARRQSVTDAFRALELGVVGFEYVRRQIGADDDDAPTPAEIDQILLLTGKAPGMAAPLQPGPPALAAALDTVAELEELSRRLVAIDQRVLAEMRGLVQSTVDEVLDDPGGEVKHTRSITRLGKAWTRTLTRATKEIAGLGIDTSSPDWALARETSTHQLVDGITHYIHRLIDEQPAVLPALPGDLLREVLATAGGSGIATVAAVPPNPNDPRQFGVSVLTTRELRKIGIVFQQWRFSYGEVERKHPFEEHKAQDGRFADANGVVDGWFPGDHSGCECGVSPVYRKVNVPDDGGDEE